MMVIYLQHSSIVFFLASRLSIHPPNELLSGQYMSEVGLRISIEKMIAPAFKKIRKRYITLVMHKGNDGSRLQEHRLPCW